MDKLDFFFLLVCIIGLFIGLVKANGRVSKLKGMVESLLIREDKEADEMRQGRCEDCKHVWHRTICQECENGSEFEPKNAEPTIKDSGERTEFSTGAVRDMHSGKGRFDLIPWEAILELAKHCEAGAEKYGERNCEKGIPIHSLIDSAIRHLAKYLMGWNDEPHLRAALWNVAFAIYMEQKHPEMQDIPARKEQAK